MPSNDQHNALPRATAGSRRSERFYLLLAVPPLAVSVIATAIFELSAFNITDLVDVVAAYFAIAPESDPIMVLGESRSRFYWSTALLLYLFTAAYLLVLSAVVMKRSLSPSGFKLFLLVGLVLSLLGIANLTYVALAGTPLSGIYSFTFDSLEASGRFKPLHLTIVQVGVSFLNGLGIVAPAFSLMAGCATLAPAPAGTPNQARHLADQMERLKSLLNGGSALLVVGVLHMHVWLRWPAALVQDPKVAAEILGFSSAVSIFWGVAFSLLIMAFYLPVAALITDRASTILAQSPEEAGGKDVKEWLQEQGLSMTPTRQLPQIAAMLAPLLAGPFGRVLGDFTNPIMGG